MFQVSFFSQKTNYFQVLCKQYCVFSETVLCQLEGKSQILFELKNILFFLEINKRKTYFNQQLYIRNWYLNPWREGKFFMLTCNTSLYILCKTIIFIFTIVVFTLNEKMLLNMLSECKILSPARKHVPRIITGLFSRSGLLLTC